MRSWGPRVLDLRLDTSFGPKWPKHSLQAPDPKVKEFFEISWFDWIHIMILEKMEDLFVEIGARVPNLWPDMFP